LLDRRLSSLSIEDHHVMVDLVAILEGMVVDFCRPAAGLDQGFGVASEMRSGRRDLLYRAPQGPPFTPGHEQAPLLPGVLQGLLF
jgi:hypothetical protein